MMNQYGDNSWGGGGGGYQSPVGPSRPQAQGIQRSRQQQRPTVGRGQRVGQGGVNPGFPNPFQKTQFPGFGQMPRPDFGPGGAQGFPPPQFGGFGQVSSNGPSQGGMFGRMGQQNPMMGMGGPGQGFPPRPNVPSGGFTGNPFMQQFQSPQPQPQQMPFNPYNPYHNDWSWNQSAPFPGMRFPAY